MRYAEITTEATMDKTWTRSDIAKMNAIAQERFDTLKPGYTKLGEITDRDNDTFEVWGKVEDGRFYATFNGKVAGYILLSDFAEGMMAVHMLFVLSKFQRRGLATALYRFVLGRGISIVSDKTLTKGSRAIWHAMMNDPKVEVTLYDPYEEGDKREVPLTNIRLAFSQMQRRMIARLK